MTSSRPVLSWKVVVIMVVVMVAVTAVVVEASHHLHYLSEDLDEIDHAIYKSTCLKKTCPIRCKFGYYPDNAGCKTCRCKANPDQTQCPDAGCPRGCYYGFDFDQNGCHICECKLGK